MTQEHSRAARRMKRIRIRYSMRTGLLVLVALCSLPVLLVAVYSDYDNYQSQRERLQEDMMAHARDVAGELDRELTSVQTGLRMLAVSPALQSGDLAAAYRYVSDSADFKTVENYALTDQRGRQLWNTLAPYGSALPDSASASLVKPVFEKRKPLLTPVFTNSLTQRPFTALHMPVERDGEVIYSLSAGLSAESVRNVLMRQPLPQGWGSATVDQTGAFVARTRDGAALSGRQALPPFLEAIEKQRDGWLDMVSRDGERVFVAFSRSEVSDWVVAVRVPKDMIMSQLHRSFAWLACGVLVAFGGGLLLALHLSRGVTTAMRGLSEASLALARKGPLALPSTSIREVQAVGAALSQASTLLMHAESIGNYDALTGLCSPVLFNELLQRAHRLATRCDSPMAVLAIELDGLPRVLERQGRDAADLVLRDAANRLVGAIRSSDMAARLESAGFAVLLIGANGVNAKMVAETLRELLGLSYQNVRSGLSAHIGIAVLDKTADNPAQVLLRAQAALARARTSDTPIVLDA